MTDCEHNLVNARAIECHKCECGVAKRAGCGALGYPWAHYFYGQHAGHAMRITCECGHVEEIGGETAPVRDPRHLLAEGVKPIDWTDDVVRRINDRAEQVLGRTRREAVYDYSKIVHCMRPPSTCTSSGCRDGTYGVCSCECDGCNGRTWVQSRGPAEGA